MGLRKRGKFWKVLFILSLGMILLTLFAPFWMPHLLKPALNHFHITFSSFERNGYSRLRLNDVRYETNNISFGAQKLEFPQPTAWLTKRFLGSPKTSDIIVEDWNLSIQPTPKRTPNTATKKTGPTAWIEKTSEIQKQIAPLISTARLTNGTLLIHDKSFGIPHATWENGQLAAQLTETNLPSTFDINLDLRIAPHELTVRLPELETSAQLKFETKSGATQITGELLWRTNSGAVSASLSDSIIPDQATFDVPNFAIPAKDLKLKGYSDLQGSAFGQWSNSSFTVSIRAHSIPASGFDLPPVSAEVRATGTTNTLTVLSAQATTHWLRANLSTNVSFNFRGELLSPEAALQVEADLDKQEFIAAKGEFRGEAFLRQSSGRYPYAAFKLTSNRFAGFGVRLNRVQVSGDLDWPLVNLNSAQLVFEDAGVAYLTGRYHGIDKTFEGGEIRLNGQIGHEFLPPELTYTNIALKATFHGPITNLTHSGKIEIAGAGYDSEGPFTTTADWSGSSRRLSKVDFTISRLATTAAVSGSVNLGTSHTDIDLQQAVVTHEKQVLMTLHERAKISAAKDQNWNVQIENLFLTGEGSLRLNANVNWPEEGTVDLSVTNLATRTFQRLFRTRLPDVEASRMELHGSWNNGPLQFRSEAAVMLRLDPTNSCKLDLNIDGDAEGVTISQLEASVDSGSILSARGTIPLVLAPHSTNAVRFLGQQPINLQAHTVPNKRLWQQIGDRTGFYLEDPKLQANITGTLNAPKGTIDFAAKQFSTRKRKSLEVPPLTDISSTIVLSTNRVHIEQFKGFVEGQPIFVTGQIPLADERETNWKSLFDWNNAEGKVSIENGQFAPFIKYAPDLLAPQGTFNAEVNLSTGLRLHGHLKIAEAATRPLPNSGALQNVNGKMRFVDQAIEIDELRGQLGGQPVRLFGRVDFASKKVGELPSMDLFIQGDNLPLARRTDLILRSDLNLRLSNLSNAIPTISGAVRLRDSFYLGDLRQLIPAKVASPRRRPPYFSFEKEPFGNWILNVSVAGDNFLQARGPLFRGTASANLKLTGTLKEPLSLGDVRVETGSVLFPFANFGVEQGLVSLTSEDPYQPQIVLNASSRAFGYDLKMELSGPVSGPVIEFTSTPSLTSEQIILMVTAGEVPRSGFGFSNEQRAQRLAMFVGKSLLSRFSDNAGAERLSITTGEDISEAGRQTYAIEYRINDNWSIVADYDRFGALNAGLKWRIYSR